MITSQSAAELRRVIILADNPQMDRVKRLRANLRETGWEEEASLAEPSAILTTGSAIETHRTGARLAADTGLPWVADVGDDFPVDDGVAAEVYRRAWLITHSSVAVADRALGLYPRAAKRIRRGPDEDSERIGVCLHDVASFPPSTVKPRSGAPAASVVVPSRNRKHLLRRLIHSALAQTVPVEVIVMDDGSTDGTANMVRADFPGVKFFELGKGRGPAFQRNRGIELASAEFVFPVDDDSVLSTPNIVEQTIEQFSDPRVAAVAIPYVNPRADWTELQRSPEAARPWVAHAYVGAAHAIRRSIFLESGGYREHFFYMGEEGDLCVRLLDRGYVVVLGNGDLIHHMESPSRNLGFADYCGPRNDIFFAWHNVPTLYLPIHLVANTANALRTALRSRNPGRVLQGIIRGYVESARRWRERRPVSAQTYRLHRLLKKSGPRPLAEVIARIPRPLPRTDDSHAND